MCRGGGEAAASLKAEEHEMKAYDLTGPQVLSYDDIAAIFSKVTGRTVTYQDHFLPRPPSRR